MTPSPQMPSSEPVGMDVPWTRGPWKWWTSNSWRRLKHDSRGLTMSVLEPFVARDGHPDCDVKPGDMALIAAAPDMASFIRSRAMAGDPEAKRLWERIAPGTPPDPSPSQTGDLTP